MASAILVAVLYRQVAGYPEQVRAGVQFAAKALLRLAIVLFGLKLNIDVILHQGLGLLARDAVVVVIAITVTQLLAKWWKADASLSLLLGIGTGVCGAAAIAAVSPIIRAKDEDTAVGAGIIALMGTVLALVYTLLRPLLPMTAAAYGIWSGTTLQEIAHVAMAAAPAGNTALGLALLAKLGRVLLLVPLSAVLLYWFNRKAPGNVRGKIEVPWFLLGFIVFSIAGSYLLPGLSDWTPAVQNGIGSVTTFILTMAMVGLGLNVHLAGLRHRAIRPLLAALTTSVLLSILMFFVI